jgi:hypothetical protein
VVSFDPRNGFGFMVFILMKVKLRELFEKLPELKIVHENF